MAAVTVIAKDGDIFVETISQKAYRAHNVFQALGAFIKDDPIFSKASDEDWVIDGGKEQSFRVWRCRYSGTWTSKNPACPRSIVFIKEA